MNLFNDCFEFTESKPIQENTKSESTQILIPIANPDVSFSNQHSENKNQNNNELNVLIDRNTINLNHQNSYLEVREFAKFQNINEIKSTENPADIGLVGESDSHRSSDFQLFNENMVNDEDEIKNEIQAINNTFVSLEQGEPKEIANNSNKQFQKDLDDYVMDEFPKKIKAENDPSNTNDKININDTAESNNISNSNEYREAQTSVNKQQNINDSQIHEDRNRKIHFLFELYINTFVYLIIFYI